MVWGQRSKLVMSLPKGTILPGYLAVYEFLSYDVAATNDEVNRRLREHITRPIRGSGGGGMTYRPGTLYSAAMGPALKAK
jgi:hypothetical protein